MRSRNFPSTFDQFGLRIKFNLKREIIAGNCRRLSGCGPFFALAEVLFVDDQQAERLAIFLRLFGVVCAVRPQDPPGVLAVQLPEPLEAPVDIHVVDEEIDQSVNGNADADEKQPEVGCGRSGNITGHARDGKHEKEQVVLFEKSVLFMVRLMVVFMPGP